MKAVIGEVASKLAFELEEIDVDTSAELQKHYGEQVPVLFIDGRRAFKFRVTAKQLAQRLTNRIGRRFNWGSLRSTGL
ncbi:MAG: Glutaredoxin-like domain [Candidatus Binatota bacterium]|nr:Glutaredoxin-like domain [Candidatus Binatota bacterium]